MANRLFIPPMGHRWRHHSRRSKSAEQTTAPAVMSSNSQPDRAAECGRSQTSSHTRMAANKANRNQAPQASTAKQKLDLQLQ